VIRLLSSIPEAIDRFRADPWSHQVTLGTPRKNMEGFLSTLLIACPVSAGLTSTDQVVFEPDNFLELVKTRGLTLENYWTFCAEASSTEDVAALLGAMLDDWIDFVFVPAPVDFAIYADHDEFLTLYAPSSSRLDHLITQLKVAGFAFVDHYVRPSGGDGIWR
jgi:hypothetical protein